MSNTIIRIDAAPIRMNVSAAQGPGGLPGIPGPNSVTSATASNSTADLDLLNVETVTATVSGTLTANHIHGNLAGSVYAHIRAGEALTKGDPVYVSGFHPGSSTAEVMKADASNAAKMPAIGIMDANVAHNNTGHMVIVGNVIDIDTSTFSVNAELYVKAGGGLTGTPPTARAQPVARVERVNLNNGAIIVKVNGLSASDATANTLVRRDSSGGAQFSDLVATTSFDAGMFAVDSLVGSTFEAGSSIAFNSTTYTYGTGAASAHRIALGGVGDSSTGTALFGAADVTAALTTLGGGNAATGTGAIVRATSPTLVTPNIGAATGQSLTLTGDIIIPNASSFRGVESRNSIIPNIGGSLTVSGFLGIAFRTGATPTVRGSISSTGCLILGSNPDTGVGGVSATTVTASGTLAVTGASTLTGGATFGGGTQQAATRFALGATTTGTGLFTAVDPGAARTVLGATTTGTSVFTAASASDARIALGGVGDSSTGTALFGAATVPAANTILANNIVEKNADFTLAQTDAGTYMRLTKTGSTQQITLPVSGISAGAEFQFYRITTQALAFAGSATVNGAANLASVPTNGAFALKHISSGTYDFI
jgi:hypothetical protein